MKGIAQTVLLLLCWAGLQRWLLGIGLILTVIGLAALASGWHPTAQPLFVMTTIIGVASAVISPVVLDAIVFRSLSAPRATRLIPRGRLKLALGAFSSQVLLALVIGVAVAVLLSSGTVGHQTLADRTARILMPVFAMVFAAFTLHFIGFFWALQFRFGFFWLLGWTVWPRLLAPAFKEWHLRELFATPTGLGAVLMISVLSWLLFAVSYLRARHIRVPYWDNFGNGPSSRSPVSRSTFYTGNFVTQGPLRYTQREAVRMLLTGTPRRRRTAFSRGLIMGLVFLVLAALSMVGMHAFRGSGLFWAGTICLLTGPAAGALAAWMAQRAKPLWLPGLGRSELFRELERRSWRMVFMMTVASVALAATLLVFSGSPLPSIAWSMGVLGVPLASGAMFVYAQLQYVRGRRLSDLLILAGSCALWLGESICVLAGVATPVVTALLATQIILVAPLRLLALRRWQNIDWLIYKPVRTAVGVG